MPAVLVAFTAISDVIKFMLRPGTIVGEEYITFLYLEGAINPDGFLRFPFLSLVKII